MSCSMLAWVKRAESALALSKEEEGGLRFYLTSLSSLTLSLARRSTFLARVSRQFYVNLKFLT